MSAGSFVNAAAQLGIQSVAIAPLPRRIYDIVHSDGFGQNDIIAQAVIEEQHMDEMEVTQHPVETGAPMTDHAYVRPAHLKMVLMWSNSPQGAHSLLNTLVGLATAESKAANKVVGAVMKAQAALSFTSMQQGSGVDSCNDAYGKLLKLMQTRSLFSVITAKRLYRNMICKSLRTGTTWKTANSMTIEMECQQIFLVNTAVTALPASLQANPQDTASLQANGAKALVPAAQGAGVL
jgi:hypothetical protein